MDARDGEWNQLLSQLRAITADVMARERLNRDGFHVLSTGYHSAVPSIPEIDASFEYAPGEVPFADEGLFDPAVMSDTLATLADYAGQFNPPMDGDRSDPVGFFWSNPMFSTCDAMVYYCMVRHSRPKTIVEVGSGFSSLVALQALRDNGEGRLICIEPYPRDFLKRLGGDRLTLVEKKVEDVPATFFQQTMAHGDMLFIDSTHTVRSGNDCVHIFLRVLPKLRVDLTVHVHDIFLPLSYPKKWLRDRQEYWTEQYLLHALLTDNPRARMTFGTIYHRLVNPVALDRLMSGKFPVGGSSFWFEFAGASAPPSRLPQFEGLAANLQRYLSEDPTAPLAARAAQAVPPVAPNVPVRDARQIIKATSFDAQFGVTRFDNHIGALDHGDWVRYPRLEFGCSITRFFAELAVPPHKAGQTIELRLDALDGPVIGTLTVAPTGSWEKFESQSTRVDPVGGVHDLFVCFGGYYGVANMQGFSFE